MNKQFHIFTRSKLWLFGVVFLFALFGFASPAHALPASFTNQLVTAGVSLPTDFAFAPDGRIFITEQGGKVRIFKNNQLLTDAAITVNVGTGGDRGLISITLDPNFQSNGFVYLLYTSNQLHQRISRFTMSGDTISGATEQVLLENPSQWGGYLNAGALRFGPDGKLYASMGDNGNGDEAQSLASLNGKMVRINSDGTIPTDNPFYNSSSGIFKSVFAYGFRNPWRFNFEPATGRAILGDVGQNTYEKIVRVVPGANYGWPMVEGDCTPNCSGITPPLMVIPHNGGGSAIVGGAINNNINFPSQYNNNYFFGNYVTGITQNFGFDGSGKATTLQTFDTGNGSLSAMNFGLDGCLWYLNIFPGELHKICYGGSIPVTAKASSDKTYGQLPLAVQFSSSGSTGNNLSYSWNFGDGTTSNSPNPSHTYTATGTYTSVLTVSNGTATSTANVTIFAGRTPPVVTITSPTQGSHYNGGSTIAFSGSAKDSTGTTIPAPNYDWLIIPHHNVHIHTPEEFNGVASGNYTIPTSGEPGADTWFEIKLIASDSAGLSASSSVNIYPNLTTLTFQTNPNPNLEILVNGQPFTAPYTVQSVVGIQQSMGVNSPQVINGTVYNFSSWSDGGAQSHNFTDPTTNTTYTANFTTSTTSTATLCNTPQDNAYTACYYNDMNLNNLVLTRTESAIAYSWAPGETPGSAVPPYGWSASWTGSFNFNAATYEFSTIADDGVRVYVDGQKIIDGWKDQGAIQYTATPTLTAGKHTIRLEFYQNGGQSQISLNWKQTTNPPPSISCPAADSGSFMGCYYSDMNLNTLVLTRNDPAINFDWGGGSPDAKVPIDHFSARWQGNFNFNAGSYTFTATGDDGIRVYVDNNPIIDKWVDQPPTAYTSTINLTAGTHAIKMEYFENGGGAVAKLSWNQNSTTTPPSTGSCPAAGNGSFTGCYYSGQTFNTFLLSRTDTTINFDWGNGSPDPLIPTDHYSARWQGSFTFNAATYTFTATADDGIRVYVDNNLVIDKWVDQPATTYTTSIPLGAGVHLVKIEYYENGGGAVAKVFWSQTSGTTTPPTTNPPPSGGTTIVYINGYPTVNGNYIDCNGNIDNDMGHHTTNPNDKDPAHHVGQNCPAGSYVATHSP